jgi:hypothetical protein
MTRKQNVAKRETQAARVEIARAALFVSVRGSQFTVRCSQLATSALQKNCQPQTTNRQPKRRTVSGEL